MKLPIININGLIVGYADDDFQKGTYSYRKEIKCRLGLVFILYKPSCTLVTVRTNSLFFKCSVEILRDIPMFIKQLNYYFSLPTNKPTKQK